MELFCSTLAAREAKVGTIPFNIQIKLLYPPTHLWRKVFLLSLGSSFPKKSQDSEVFTQSNGSVLAATSLEENMEHAPWSEISSLKLL